MSNLTSRQLINGANDMNQRRAICQCCGTVLAPREGYSAPLASNGGRAQYVCYSCYSGMNNISYGQHAHAAARGKQAKSGLTYSVELELKRPDALTRAELAAVGFVATADCTTDTEFKMPPRGNLNNSKTWSTVEQLLSDGHCAITDSEGTHVHIGHGDVEHKQEDGNPTPDLINPYSMGELCRRADIMLLPLLDKWQEFPAHTVRVFGRYFNRMAKAGVSDADRYRAINITNAATIEYRLPRFRTAGQYRHCLKTCAALTKTVVTNYMQYADDEWTDPAKLDHKAEVTARKLVKVWCKYAASAPNWEDANGESNGEVVARIWH